MGEVETVRITHPDVPGGMLINKSAFDEKIHTLHKGGKASGTRKPKPTETIEERGAALDALPAADVKVIAEGLGLEHSNKADSIALILRTEYPDA